MLSSKLDGLRSTDTPPAWFVGLPEQYLDLFGRLGNAAIHPNDGDIRKQEAFDRDLVLALRALMNELLDRVYERPAAQSARLTDAAAALGRLEQAPDPGPTGVEILPD